MDTEEREVTRSVEPTEVLRAGAEQRRERAERERSTAEREREVADDERSAGEEQRQITEEGRIASESVRQHVEALRQVAEELRIEAEAARRQAEQLRVEQEELRQEHETLRMEHEQLRIDHEQLRTLGQHAGEMLDAARRTAHVALDDTASASHELTEARRELALIRQAAEEQRALDAEMRRTMQLERAALRAQARAREHASRPADGDPH